MYSSNLADIILTFNPVYRLSQGDLIIYNVIAFNLGIFQCEAHMVF